MSRTLIAAALAFSLASGSLALAQYGGTGVNNTSEVDHSTQTPNTNSHSAQDIKNDAKGGDYRPNTITKTPAPSKAKGVPPQGNQPIGN